MEHQSGKIVFICEECAEARAEMRGEGIENGFELDESYLKHRNTLGFVFEPVVEERAEPKCDRIEHWCVCQHKRNDRREKLNDQAIVNGHAGVCRENAILEGTCSCGGNIWSDDEEICIPPLGEQKPMHMDCASEYMDVMKRESEAEMYYQDDGWD